MSRKLSLSTLSENELTTLSTDLQIAKEASKYAFSSQPTYIYLYEAEGDDLYIPFAYGKHYPRPERTLFSERGVAFQGALRESQKEVKSEAISRLNSHGSVIVAAYPGYGKCLQKDTPVLMFDRTVKPVQEIKVGELLMGDDSLPRRVLSTCQGEEQLYRVIPKYGDSFGANESHILSLKRDTTTVDISIRDYLRLPETERKQLRAYRVPLRTTLEDRKAWYSAVDRYGVFKEETIVLRSAPEETLLLARSLGYYAVRRGGDTVVYQEIGLTSEFRIEPILDDRRYYGFTIDGNRRFLLGDLMVTHNTATSIYMASKIRLRTLIICHRIVLVQQWKESIKKFCPDATVQIVEGGGSVLEDVDFYIMNVVNVAKYPKGFYRDIGTVIVDECHLIMAEKLSMCMRYVTPRYLVGLSATPYRTDGLDALLDMYFGKYKIVRTLHRKHTVYRYDTGFKPEAKLNRMGKVDWGSVLNSQSVNTNRNEAIVRIIKYFPDRVFLILCKRVAQAEYLVRRLEEEKEDVTSLIGSNQEFERSSRVLVGTVQKTGVGFDHPRLNTLLLASDVEQYFVQYLGRVFRCEDSEPIIFDLVDNYSLLQKHFKTRQAVYVENGGVVRDFRKEFPDFR